MNINISLPILILGEVVFALAVVLFFAIRHILKQRAQIHKLLAKFQELKAAYEHQHYKSPSFYDNKKPLENRDIINDYFAQSLADSLQRYEKYTASTHPHLEADHPYSGKVAALRSIYLAAEKEVFEERGITHAGWGTFEKRLAELVHWQDQKNSYRQEVRSQRTRVLQEEIARLKDYQRQLEQYQMDSQRTINSLSSMLDKLKHLPAPASPPHTATSDLWDDHSLNKFADNSSERNRQMIDLLSDLKNYPSQFSPAARKRMEDQLNILEIELMKSDQYISNLKKELKEAKLQATNYALQLRDVSAGGTDEGNPEATQPLYAGPPGRADLGEQKNILTEIQQLRDNNKRQRVIIGELEQEIHSLRISLDTTDSTDQRRDKEAEIQRLERLVKECQACINTLESEVDSLYAQLQEKVDQQPDIHPEQGNPEMSEELGMITRELEKTVAHYQQLHAINYLMMDFMKCNSVEQLAKQLVQFIKTFHAAIGFSIHSLLGKAEYFPASYFNDALKALVKSTSFSEPITHLEPIIHKEEGTLFINSKMRAMLLPSPGNSHSILETSLASLLYAAEEGIKRLEAEKLTNKYHYTADEWTSRTKNLLSDLDIQYAYQVEENRKTFNHFIAELRRAYHLLDLHGPGAIVLDNAINEFEERIHLLIHSSEVIDKEISQLLEHMESLDSTH